MIKIPKISKELEDLFYKDNSTKLVNKLLELKSENSHRKIINYLCKDESKSKEILDKEDFDNDKIRNLLVGGVDELKKIKKAIGTMEESDNVGFHRLYKNFSNRKLGKRWADTIGVRVCPYCNRSYVFTLDNGEARPQYDHYFPKSSYPYLAISMYNLVPCCSICNSAKGSAEPVFDISIPAEGKQKYIIYPYQDEYGYDIYFETCYEGDFKYWLGDSENFSIDIKIKTDD